MKLPLAVENQFPLLRKSGYEVTSPETIDYRLPRYNCIAFAADDQTLWWWPDQHGVGYWPDRVPREITRRAFLQAYGTLGYRKCRGGELEKGFEKIAIYEKDGAPTHAAKQQDSGRWKSKLGCLQDVEHNTVEAVQTYKGVGEYGAVAVYMKRKRRGVVL